MEIYYFVYWAALNSNIWRIATSTYNVSTSSTNITRNVASCKVHVGTHRDWWMFAETWYSLDVATTLWEDKVCMERIRAVQLIPSERVKYPCSIMRVSVPLPRPSFRSPYPYNCSFMCNVLVRRRRGSAQVVPVTPGCYWTITVIVFQLNVADKHNTFQLFTVGACCVTIS